VSEPRSVSTLPSASRYSLTGAASFSRLRLRLAMRAAESRSVANIVRGDGAQPRAWSWRAGNTRAVASATAAAAPGRAPLQRVGDPGRRWGRARRHRHARAGIDGRARAGDGAGGAGRRGRAVARVYPRPHRSLGAGGDDPRAGRLRILA